MEARLAVAAGQPERAVAALQAAIQNTSDSGVLAASIELALEADDPGLAVAAALRVAAFRPVDGADLLRHVTGRLLVIEVRSGEVAEALVTACVAQALLGQVLEPPAVVRRSFERAVEAGAALIRGRPSAEAALLLATAGQALDAPWVAPLLAYARRVGEEQPTEIKAESLPSLARALLGFSGSSTPATPW